MCEKGESSPNTKLAGNENELKHMEWIWNVQVNLQIRKKDRFPDNALDYLNSPTHVKKKKSPFYISSV